jgi:hypothetical protein
MTISGAVIRYEVVLSRSHVKEVLVMRAEEICQNAKMKKSRNTGPTKGAKTVTVTFISGEVLEVSGLREGDNAQNLLRQISNMRKLSHIQQIQLLEGDRHITCDEILAGDNFTAIERLKTFEELDEVIDDDPYTIVEELAAALGLQADVCPHDLARDETIVFVGAVRHVASEAGPFAGMPDIKCAEIEQSEVERVDKIIQEQVLPALLAPNDFVKMAGYQVRPPQSAQYYVWPNDCACCS